MDHLPPFKYSLNAPGQLLLTKQELNKIIKEDIFRQYIQVTWVDPLRGLNPKMAFYAKHFMELRDGLIVQPPYTLRHRCMLSRFYLGNFGWALIDFGSR
jgi:hypothetical protein